jgi:YegS/Rv2252/BmrU family lipid kinase
MKYLLIVNPVSGMGHARRELASVRRYFEKRDQELTLRLTDGPGDAERLAREGAAADYDAIIVGGGDGTINEVLNGMRGSGKKLAVIPWGTGNVFATEMRFPKGVSAICRMILKGHSGLLDLGVYGDRLFLLMVGAGFDGYSLKQLQGQGLKRRLGLIAYAAAAFRALARYHYPLIQVELDGGRVDSGSFVLVSNTSRYGDFFSFTPRATPLDGFLDVFVFRETGRWNTIILALRYLIRFIADPNLSSPPLGLQRVGLYRAKTLRLSSNKPVFTQIDGELGASLPMDIGIATSAIELILPRRSLRKYRRKLGAGDDQRPARG